MDPVVEVKQGKLRGKLTKTLNGGDYYSFNGIPYAEQPIDNLRFKDPVPVKPWDGIKDATKEGGIAAQLKMELGEYCGSDDCLYINVHTPNLKPETKFPVIVNVHSGAFVSGSGNSEEWGPDFIIEQHVILVNFNYRLGVMGFLCTDTINARGDMGLKDQNLAMKWVKENIDSFGGDSNNITLLGISAGAVGVEYHILSPLSAGLFNKAIIQSGSSLDPWGRTRGHLEYATRLAKTFGYDPKNGETLFDFINKIPTKDLVIASSNLIKTRDLIRGNHFPFAPAINELKDYDGFLNEEPALLFNTGRFNKVPVLMGFCEKEGMLMKMVFNGEEVEEDFKNKNFIKYIPPFLNKSGKNLDERMKNIYCKRPEDLNADDNEIDFLSDLNFNAGIFCSLDKRLRNDLTENYFYCFSYDGNLNLLKFLTKTCEKGACHSDEIGYLFNVKDLNDVKATAADLYIRDCMVKMWANFAKFGNPTPDTGGLLKEKWLPVTKEKFQYLNICDDLELLSDLTKDRKELWKEIYCNL